MGSKVDCPQVVRSTSFGGQTGKLLLVFYGKVMRFERCSSLLGITDGVISVGMKVVYPVVKDVYR